MWAWNTKFVLVQLLDIDGGKSLLFGSINSDIGNTMWLKGGFARLLNTDEELLNVFQKQGHFKFGDKLGWGMVSGHK